ncbi:helix-turn-helix domain-containing protein [Lacisediminihabitans sp. H27-G8]|uniref:helix-turn-helix domain-containing protein n=1 Tax=Lacisediminihabitans sp. H27-G8 TaxID=3111909 RepID=UPI0038FBF65F
MRTTEQQAPQIPQPLGPYLKSARRSVGMTLRDVEAKSEITNGYLSQIENQLISKPSPNVLFELAELYGLDYSNLLARAGHRVPSNSAPNQAASLNGIPLRALEDLNESERKDLMDYVQFLKSKR